MSQTDLDVAGVVSSLGGNPLSRAPENLELLANEILILRERVRDAERAEGQAERKLGKEAEAKRNAEIRADEAETALSSIDLAIGRAKRNSLARGAPMHLPDGSDAAVAG